VVVAAGAGRCPVLPALVIVTVGCVTRGGGGYRDYAVVLVDLELADDISVIIISSVPIATVS